MAVTIPSQVADSLGLNEGDQLVFLHKNLKKFVIVGTSEMLTTRDDDLKNMGEGALGIFGSSTLSRDDIKTLLKEMAGQAEKEDV